MTPRPPTADEVKSGPDRRRTVAFVVAIGLGGFAAFYLFPTYVHPVLADATPLFGADVPPRAHELRIPVTPESLVTLCINIVVTGSVLLAFERSRFAPEDE